MKNILEDINKLKKKKKINIDQASNEFKILTKKLIENHKTEDITYSEILKMSNFTGIAESKSESIFLIKSQFLENEVYKLRYLDLDINSVLEKILGKEVFEQIIERINIGTFEIENKTGC